MVGSVSKRCVVRLSLVVVLTDDFTGMPIKASNARAWIDGQKPPIKKPDGRSIFLDLPEGEHIVNAEGGFYQLLSVKCKITAKGAQTLNMRLLPNSSYPVPPDAVRFEGKAEPNAKITLYSPDKGAAFKLLSDVKKGDSVIGIYHPGSINIEGKLLKIEDPEGKGEYLTVKELAEGDRSEYTLAEKLKAAYPKVGTIIVPAAQTFADKKGRFMLLVRSSFSGGSSVVCEAVGKKKKTKTFEISDSKYITADMLK